jgi:hypothetical protein
MSQITFTVDGVTITIHDATVEDTLNEESIRWSLGLRGDWNQYSHAQRTKWISFARLFARTDSVEGIDGWALPSPDDSPGVIREAFEKRTLIPVSVFEQWRGRIYAMDEPKNERALLPPNQLSDQEQADPQSGSAGRNSGHGSNARSSGASSRKKG